jgi:integrase
MVFLMLLRRMGRTDITAHGFRSSFRDWAAEKTSAPQAVIEAALAHVIRNKTEAAYFRSDLFDLRRQLMADWARFALTSCEAKGSAVPRAQSSSTTPRQSA